MTVFLISQIGRAHVEFYNNLFSPEPIDSDCKQLLLSGFLSFLSDDDRNFCDKPISLAELTAALNSLSLRKSPGPDGFSVEFDLKFWDLLGPLLFKLTLECFDDGTLPESMLGSATRLIFKKLGDKNLKNWRPISLLNVDYKIISRILTTRFSLVLGSIVHPD